MTAPPRFPLPDMANPARYEIWVKGLLDPSWKEWFEPMEILTQVEQGQPVLILTGQLPDQAALYGILHKLYTLRLPLIRVQVIDR